MGIAVGGGGYLIGQLGGGALHFGVAEAAAHQPLDGKESVFGVGDRLPFGDLAHVSLAGAGVEGDHRRGKPGALGVFDDDRLAGFDDRGHRVGGSKVDSQDLSHWASSCWVYMVAVGYIR